MDDPIIINVNLWGGCGLGMLVTVLFKMIVLEFLLAQVW